jgi:hypothetical protein
MFKKNLTFVFAMCLILFSCDELGIDPVELTVPASASYTFDMSAETINASSDKSASISQNVNIANLVDENADKIDKTKLKKMTFQVTGYTGGASANFTIQTRKNGTLNTILTLADQPLQNTEETVLFQDGRPTNPLSASIVASLESLMDEMDPFELIVKGQLSDTAESDFKITIAWDLDITVKP